MRGDTFDFGLWDGSRNPDYGPVFANRARRLAWLRALELDDRTERKEAAAKRVDDLLAYYRTAPEGVADFIEDWGITFDAGLVSRGLDPYIPFLLFPKQREFVNWVVAKVRSPKAEQGIADKTRQMGFSWLAVSIGCALCILHRGFVAGYGSRLKEYVDEIGNPKALFPKARIFMERLPRELRAGYQVGKTDKFANLTFPANGSIMMGEGGDNIGRGGTTALYVVDESSHLEHPDLIDASLGQGHSCRIDISTPNGLGNPFARKRFSWPSADIFTMHWRADPRKNDAWYNSEKARLSDVVFAQEVDIDYTASVSGVVIPGKWLQACVDAHVKLGVEPTGKRRAAFDVADEGGDNCGLAVAMGILVENVQEWSGAGQDIIKSLQFAFRECDRLDLDELTYDADGMGAGVRAGARVLNETRKTQRRPVVTVVKFQGSGPVVKPDAQQEPGRKNKDYFMNCKAQSWHRLKQLVYNTYRAVTEGAKFNPDEIISLNGKMPNLQKLIMELSQPTWEETTVGKMMVDKTPEGTKSPNLADSVMMLYSPARRTPLKISKEAMEAA